MFIFFCKLDFCKLQNSIYINVKSIDFIKSNWKIITIMLSIYIVIVYSALVNYNQSIKSYDEYKFNELRNMLNSTKKKAIENSNLLKSLLLQNDTIISNLKKATGHQTQENDKLRIELSRNLKSLGIDFSKYAIGKINFILPDKTIFFRYFEPYSYDTLVPYKQPVEDVFKTNEPVYAFNRGMYHNMFSCFYPIILNNNIICVLEIGYSDYLFTAQLFQENNRINIFIYPIDKNFNVDNRFFVNFPLIPSYKVNLNSLDFVSNNLDVGMESAIKSINIQKIDLKNKLIHREDVSIHKSNFLSIYSVYLFPIYDYENKVWGYFFHSYENFSFENKARDLLINLVVSGLFVLIFITSFINRKNLTTKLNSRIQELHHLKNKSDNLIRELNVSQVELQNKVKFSAQINTLLHEQDAELKKAIDEKNKFFSILAHDIKNPISTIYTNAELMELYYESMSPDERKDLINRLIQSSKNLESLVKDLLEWGQLQLNRIEIELTQFKISNSVEKAFHLIKDQAINKKVTLINAIDENISIVSDKRIIDTIFRNLIQNAIKFTENGEISVEIFNQSKNYISIDFKDTGVGIPAQKLKDIFKIDKAFTTKGTKGESGTGLGLVLIHSYLMRIDGKINVESQIGKGTRFTITLPKPDRL